MARVRSPNFPVFGLSKAIDRARTIFDKEQQLPATRDTLSKHLGYGGYNGKSAKVLSALGKYGLLETGKSAGTFRLTERAMRILFPKNDSDKQTAINEAARTPALFQEIEAEWDGGRPSDENLSNYLLRNGFSQSAIGPVIAAYQDTINLVTRMEGPYSAFDDALEDEAEEEDMEVATRERPPRNDAVTYRLGASEPFKVQLVKGGVQGSFDIRNLADLEDFMAGLTALKVLIPKEEAKPESA